MNNHERLEKYKNNLDLANYLFNQVLSSLGDSDRMIKNNVEILETGINISFTISTIPSPAPRKNNMNIVKKPC